MRRLEASDIVPLRSALQDHYHSYFLLKSLHGFSASEMQESLDDSHTLHFLEQAGERPTLLSLGQFDRQQGNMQLQLCGRLAQPELARHHLRAIQAGSGIARVYSFLFEHETAEAQSLLQLGLHAEARLREHLFVNGRYHDLLVFGCVEPVP
ncbi:MULTISPECIES: hypothetical protein [unclassified Undibacterium]|uniref:hypothetical protein n=1 Tax=unclassified Undibacterium TaxID=2630295 RepID=UPI002AC9AF05|nr:MULTISPECIES: hypothetical protein [unclassified Undibacterium]MEB0140416.1 hypothetical protein [Undibacterium sp. CCC2.1]MEB0171694.1 hypothetical protein [Undibacterium sp. CCC1.1]MEB0177415.1 hypothetical protein [Undibacterium sp. CCC3.4]MEB0215040.1 hypothetical protein [Undibacterium sp. 5I2]WPX45113.1 hypothetical protein RHM61_07785 [Undibacterium sp. CCC3.4]